MENKRSMGSEYEKKAAEYLKASGCSICEMNYRCRFGEIDMIAQLPAASASLFSDTDTPRVPIRLPATTPKQRQPNSEELPHSRPPH